MALMKKINRTWDREWERDSDDALPDTSFIIEDQKRLAKERHDYVAGLYLDAKAFCLEKFGVSFDFSKDASFALFFEAMKDVKDSGLSVEKNIFYETMNRCTWDETAYGGNIMEYLRDLHKNRWREIWRTESRTGKTAPNDIAENYETAKKWAGLD